MSDLAEEVRLLRRQIGELARILAPSGYPYDPALPDGEASHDRSIEVLREKAGQQPPSDREENDRG